MRFIKLKKVTFEHEEIRFTEDDRKQIGCVRAIFEKCFDYRQQLISLLTMKADGLTNDDLRRSIKVLDKLYGGVEGQWLRLKDDEYEVIADRLKGVRWPFVHHAFVDFLEAIETAPTEEPEELSAVSAQ